MQPIHLHFIGSDNGFRLVAIDHLPEGGVGSSALTQGLIRARQILDDLDCAMIPQTIGFTTPNLLFKILLNQETTCTCPQKCTCC